MNIWKGKRFDTTGILVLGESTYGEDDPLTEYIEKWIEGKLQSPDRTFSRIFTACTGLTASNSTQEQRRKFWESVGYYNFVPGSIGSTNKSKATDKHFRNGKAVFPKVLQEVKPRAVWVLGKRQAEFSQPLLISAGIPHEVVAHPTSHGLPTEQLQDSWKRLLGKAGSLL